MTVIMIALDSCLFDGAVHSLDPVSSTGQALSVRPWVLDLGCPVFSAVFTTGAAKYVAACEVILFAVGELNAIVSENGMNGVGNGLDKVAQEGRGNHFSGSLV